MFHVDSIKDRRRNFPQVGNYAEAGNYVDQSIMNADLLFVFLSCFMKLAFGKKTNNKH